MEQTAQSEEDKASSGRSRLLSISVGALGVFIFFRQFFLSGGKLIVGDMADGRLIMCIHEHWYRFLMGKEGFFEMDFFYPEKNILGYSDTFLLGGIFHSVFRFIGLDVFLSFQLVQILMCVLGFTGMLYWLNKYRNIPYPVALFGSFLFIIASPIFISSRNSHIQLQAVWLIPWVIIFIERAWHDAAESQRDLLKSFSCLTLLYGLLLYSTFYIGWFFLLYSVLWVVSACILVGPREIYKAIRLRFPSWPYLLPGIIILVLVGLLFLRTYLPVRMLQGGRPFDFVLQSLPRLLDLINHSQTNLLWGNVASILHPYLPNFFWECEVGPTFLVTLFTLFVSIGLISGKIPGNGISVTLVRTSGLATIISLLLVFRIYDYSLWKIPYLFMPGAEGIRIPPRYIILLTVPIVYQVAWGFSWLSSFRPRGLSLVLLVLIGTFMLLEQIQLDTNAKINRCEELAILRRLPAPPKDAIAFFAVGNYKTELERASIHNSATVYSQHWNLPTLSGQSGFHPKGWLLQEPVFSQNMEGLIRWGNSRNLSGLIYFFNVDTERWEGSVQFPVIPDFKGQLNENLLTSELFYPMAYEGWSVIEPWGIWVEGKRSRLEFPQIGNIKTTLNLEIGFQAYLNKKLPRQSFVILINGKKAYSDALSNEKSSGDTILELPEHLVRAGFTLEFLTPDAASPESLGKGNDTRVLGIGLTRMILRDPSDKGEKIVP